MTILNWPVFKHCGKASCQTKGGGDFQVDDVIKIL